MYLRRSQTSQVKWVFWVRFVCRELCAVKGVWGRGRRELWVFRKLETAILAAVNYSNREVYHMHHYGNQP